MSAGETTLMLFSTRVRQMILEYKDTKKENLSMQAELERLNAKILRIEAELSQATNDYNSLKMAKMLEITDGDMESAKKRLAKLIRDVDKCITLLSEK